MFNYGHMISNRIIKALIFQQYIGVLSLACTLRTAFLLYGLFHCTHFFFSINPTRQKNYMTCVFYSLRCLSKAMDHFGIVKIK